MNYLFIKLLNLLNYILKNRILLMFLYSHSSKSSSYDFQINKKKVDTLKKNKIKNNDFKFVFSKLFRSMTQTKLIPVPLSKNLILMEVFILVHLTKLQNQRIKKIL